MNVDGYELVNEEKVSRVIGGTQQRGGKLSGGLGKNADDADVLAQYDRIGGAITKDGVKVKTGCFWNFEDGEAVKNPKVVFVYRVNGKEIEVPEGGKKPIAVQAAELESAQVEESHAATGDGAVEAPAAPAKKKAAKKKAK